MKLQLHQFGTVKLISLSHSVFSLQFLNMLKETGFDKKHIHYIISSALYCCCIFSLFYSICYVNLLLMLCVKITCLSALSVSLHVMPVSPFQSNVLVCVYMPVL